MIWGYHYFRKHPYLHPWKINSPLENDGNWKTMLPFLGIYGLTSSEFSSSAALRSTWEEAEIVPQNLQRLKGDTNLGDFLQITHHYTMFKIFLHLKSHKTGWFTDDSFWWHSSTSKKNETTPTPTIPAERKSVSYVTPKNACHIHIIAVK